MKNTFGNIISGKTIALNIMNNLSNEVILFKEKYNRVPCLHVVLVGNDSASHIYVRNKEKACKKVGISSVIHRYDYITESELINLIKRLNDSFEVDGILVQLPLPNGISEDRILDCISPEKDVDGLHPMNIGLLAGDRSGIIPCTPLGCMKLIEETGVELKGANVLIIGCSNLVGKPLAQLLLKEYATVTLSHIYTKNIQEFCCKADIVIVAAGQPELVKESWVKSGAVIIDVGINRKGGKIVGDVDFDKVKKKAFAITPVPGGVGPMTVVYLLKNTLYAARMQKGLKNE